MMSLPSPLLSRCTSRSSRLTQPQRAQARALMRCGVAHGVAQMMARCALALSSALLGCDEPSTGLGEGEAWLSRWDRALSAPLEPRACPLLTLPNLRLLPVGVRPAPYYGERLELEWASLKGELSASPETLEERFEETLKGLSWRAELEPIAEQGLYTLFVRARSLTSPLGERLRSEPLPTLSETCARELVGQVTSRSYWVTSELPGDAFDPRSSALWLDDPELEVWASEVMEVSFGEGVSELYQETAQALGEAEGTPLQTLSLGEGGAVTLRLSEPIGEREGAELAVFENSFNHTFLELAWVEVSSNGRDFARLPNLALTPEPIGAFGEQPPSRFLGLAGRLTAGASPPFDLYSLEGHPLVQLGALDLSAVRFVRIVDVIGDGRSLDSALQPIYDPYPTQQSAGFDLDAVGAKRAQ